MNMPRIQIRRAGPDDQAAIEALVRSEHLKPTDLRWPSFVVACDGERLVGAVQMRHHLDGSHELGSLVVAPAWRGQGLATRLVDSLLAGFPGPMHMITQRRHATHFERWGFRPVAALRSPLSVRLHWVVGQSMSLWSLLLRRRPARRLAVLGRRLG
jgi:amino-acid N-acetyltransferase